MTDQEVVYAFESILGITPRAPDLAVLRALSPADLTAADVAAYITRHTP